MWPGRNLIISNFYDLELELGLWFGIAQCSSAGLPSSSRPPSDRPRTVSLSILLYQRMAAASIRLRDCVRLVKLVDFFAELLRLDRRSSLESEADEDEFHLMNQMSGAQ